MTVREILVNWLHVNRFDGLINHDRNCSCVIGNLAPCEHGEVSECNPGYKVPCDGKCPQGKCDFHISLYNYEWAGGEKPREDGKTDVKGINHIKVAESL